MKNILAAFGAIIIFAAVVTGFIIVNQPPDSTDLSDVLIDGLSIGSPTTDTNPQKYGSSSQLTESHTFEILSPDGSKDLLFISLAGSEISFISMAFGHEDIPITINNHTVSSIEEVSRLLGRAYREDEYDHEHAIMMHRYRDHEHHISASFLYDRKTHQLTKLILDKIPE